MNGPNRTQIPKWTTELPKHMNGPTYTAKDRVGYGRAGIGSVYQDRSKVGVGCVCVGGAVG